MCVGVCVCVCVCVCAGGLSWMLVCVLSEEWSGLLLKEMMAVLEVNVYYYITISKE